MSQDKSNISVHTDRYFARLKLLMDAVDRNAIEKFIHLLELKRSYVQQCCIYICGNGGSAATAAHWANDLLSLGFSSSSLSSDSAVISCLANDFGWDEIFLRQLSPALCPIDILVCISASGASRNLILAAEYARSKGIPVVCLTGFDGGRLLELATISLHVPTAKGEYGPVEDVHLMLNHLITGYLRKTLTQKVPDLL